MHIDASNAVLTKARTKFGNRLTEKNYRDMLSLNTVADAASYLKTNTHYKESLKDVNESAIHRGNLEALLKSKMFSDFAALCRFERSVGEQFNKYLLLRGEIDEILSFLRFFQSGNTADYIFTMPEYFNRNAPLDIVSLSKVNTYEEFLSLITNEELKKILKPFNPGDKQVIDYTMIEAALDRFLFESLMFILKKHFRGDTRRELKKIFGQKAEFDNIKMIYRAKKYYSAKPEAIRAKLIHHTEILSKKQLDALILAENAEQVKEELLKTGYRRIFSGREEETIDYILDIYMYRTALKYMRFSVNPAVVMACSIILFEFEIDDVTNVIEGIRYESPPEEIRRLLVSV